MNENFKILVSILGSLILVGCQSGGGSSTPTSTTPGTESLFGGDRLAGDDFHFGVSPDPNAPDIVVSTTPTQAGYTQEGGGFDQTQEIGNQGTMTDRNLAQVFFPSINASQAEDLFWGRARRDSDNSDNLIEIINNMSVPSGRSRDPSAPNNLYEDFVGLTSGVGPGLITCQANREYSAMQRAAYAGSAFCLAKQASQPDSIDAVRIISGVKREDLSSVFKQGERPKLVEIRFTGEGSQLTTSNQTGGTKRVLLQISAASKENSLYDVEGISCGDLPSTIGILKSSFDRSTKLFSSKIDWEVSLSVVGGNSCRRQGAQTGGPTSDGDVGDCIDTPTVVRDRLVSDLKPSKISPSGLSSWAFRPESDRELRIDQRAGDLTYEYFDTSLLEWTQNVEIKVSGADLLEINTLSEVRKKMRDVAPTGAEVRKEISSSYLTTKADGSGLLHLRPESFTAALFKRTIPAGLAEQKIDGAQSVAFDGHTGQYVTLESSKQSSDSFREILQRTSRRADTQGERALRIPERGQSSLSCGASRLTPDIVLELDVSKLKTRHLGLCGGADNLAKIDNFHQSVDSPIAAATQYVIRLEQGPDGSDAGPTDANVPGR